MEPLRVTVVAAALAVMIIQEAGADEAAPPRLPEDHAEALQRALCGPPLAARPDPEAAERRTHPDTPVTVIADETHYDGRTGLYTYTGDVLMERIDQRLTAGRVTYDERSGVAELSDGFTFSQGGLNARGSHGRFYTTEDFGLLFRTEYRLYERYIHGDAERAAFEGAQRMRLDRVRYTTCAPGEEVWWLEAERVDLDRETGRGSARHARLTALGVPVFYTPYITFPIDDRRRTGFLPPRFTSSRRSGEQLTLPFYWNIAPNYDATLFPTYYSRRGTQLGVLFRYLRPTFEGDAAVEFLPDDDQTGDDRWLVGLDHTGEAGFLDYDLELNRVSDDDYFRDFDGDLIRGSTSELESRAAASVDERDHRVDVELQTWQNLRGDAPYRRLPRLRYRFRPGPGFAGLRYDLAGEAVSFDHPDAGPEFPTGQRLDLTPRVSLPWRRPAFFVEPGVELRHTQYDLDRFDPAALDESPSRTVPVASLDAGVFLERPYVLEDRVLIQTLEPRLFYLYAPRRDQDDIPVFDTRRRDDSFASLFDTNRFTGADRVGDANQLTTALTTRLQDATAGREYLTASVGQILYFRDREVGLEAGEIPERDRRSTSDLFGELRAELPMGLRASTEYRYNPDEDRSEQWRAGIRHHPRIGQALNLDYRMRRDLEGALDLEQVELSAVTPLGVHWSTMGRLAYSLLDDRTLEAAAGLEYRSCCFRVRAMVREYLPGDDEPRDRAVMLELELTGLGAFGDGVEDFIEDVIPGYGRDRW